ncbi:uncharacterized protein [Pyrus communis]|uniref:uncharacterized protein n=1 Tax=Pyrus communis TaxID=23211 RepID=UPI0035C2009E
MVTRLSRRMGAAVGDTGCEGGYGVLDLDLDGADAKAVGGGEGAGGGVVEGRDRGRGSGPGLVGGSGQGGGVRGGEEENEVAGAEELPWACPVPRRIGGRLGGVGAPELDVVEPVDFEAVGPGVGPYEVGEANEVELGVVFLAHGAAGCGGCRSGGGGGGG